MNGRTVYFERSQIDAIVRLCAIDSETGTEAVVFGPAATPTHDLEALALRKLEKILARAAEPPPVPPRRGKLV